MDIEPEITAADLELGSATAAMDEGNENSALVDNPDESTELVCVHMRLCILH